MATPISAQLRSDAAGIIEQSSLPGSDLAKLLNAVLNRYLSAPYHADSGRVVAINAHESLAFDSIIHTASTNLTQIPADNVACVIAVHQNMGLEEVRTSYEKFAQVKTLDKSPRQKTPGGFTPADATMGIIFSVDSSAPLELLAEEIKQLNKGYSYRHWTDMIVVLSRGTISYACQFPDKPLGDWLPPAHGPIMLAPMYLHILARPHAAFALNRMCGLLFPYLYLFSPDAGLPNYKALLEGAPTTGMTITPYQLNLKGEMVPVPPEQRFNPFFVFPLGFRAEDRKGKVLSRVEYLPWQDGGVVRTSGKLPIEAFLVFAGKEAISQPIIRLPDAQMSSVIPLSKEQFIQMAERTARQSNLVIKPDGRPKWIVEKMGDEGTSSPFIARLFLGILSLRNQAQLDPLLYDQFDKAFEAVMTGIEGIRAESKHLFESYALHCQKLDQGTAAKIIGNSIHLVENISKDLKKQSETVIGNAGRICKDRMQVLLRCLGVDIGFLFKKQDTFVKEISNLRHSNPALADYLEQTRSKWLERLVLQRNAIEHEGRGIPRVQYFEASGKVRAVEPLIDGQPFTKFIAFIVDRTCCFIEELCIYALQSRLPNGISITEILFADRKPENKERFRLALIGGGMPIWEISYHDSKFEDT